MISRSKLSLAFTIAVLALLLGGTAHAANLPIDSSSTPSAGVLATAWNWLVSVFVPAPGSPTPASSADPKAGCEMDPNGTHLMPDPSSPGSTASFHQ